MAEKFVAPARSGLLRFVEMRVADTLLGFLKRLPGPAQTDAKRIADGRPRPKARSAGQGQ